jgi:hypothetical protein
MDQQAAKDFLDLARNHLGRVQDAWDEPTDWTDLSIYGFLCLEAAIMAAAKSLGYKVKPIHREKAEAAERLSKEQGLPDIYDLLWDLNAARKAAAYGDVSSPTFNAEDLARKIETYVEAVELLVGKSKPPKPIIVKPVESTPQKPIEENNVVWLNEEILEYAGGINRLTFLNWIKHYRVDGKPLAIKVGGRWRVYKDRLDKFLQGGGEKIL